MKSIDTLLGEIDKNRANCPPEVDRWISEELADIRSEIIRLNREESYQRYIRRHIASYEPEAHDGDPRCTCGNDCPILNGRLPAMVKGADDPGRAAEEWAIRHPGTPHAMLSADDAYREDLAALYNDVHRVRLASDRGTVVEPGETGAGPQGDADVTPGQGEEHA